MSAATLNRTKVPAGLDRVLRAERDFELCRGCKQCKWIKTVLRAYRATVSNRNK